MARLAGRLVLREEKVMLYHKIESVFLRDPATQHRTFLDGQWTMPAFGYLADLEWEWTEKVDGTNIRIALTESGPVLGGKTEAAQIYAFLLPVLNEIGARGIGARGTGMGFLEGLTLVGEGYGPKIQSGGDYRPDHGFILFDVFTDHDNPLQRRDVEIIATQLDIPVVPIIGRGKLSAAIEQVQRGFLSEVAEGRRRAEGLVMRPTVELRDRQGHRIITKAKTKDFM